VGALERVKNPISVARKVMERTNHVLLVGAGAKEFARKMGFADVDLLTPEAKAEWSKLKDTFWRAGAPAHTQTARHDTVCGIALDHKGDLATAVSTSGLPRKIGGRVGDSPILGAGSYVDNAVGAACATGRGELTMRTLASFQVVQAMHGGAPPTVACEEVLRRVMKLCPELKDDHSCELALIALDKHGRYGAATARQLKGEEFRYALMRGLDAPPALHDVKPLLAS
jgi:isoaspartyl peptidase/L-asparaginase-like protein (Ntn-hydrolase superfamily)